MNVRLTHLVNDFNFNTARWVIEDAARGLNLGVEVIRDPEDHMRVIVSARNAMPWAGASFDFGAFSTDPSGCLARVERWFATLEARPSPPEAGAMAVRAIHEVTGEHADVQVMTDAEGQALSVEVRFGLFRFGAGMRPRLERTADVTVVRIGPGWVRELQTAVADTQLDEGARGRWIQREPASRTRKPWRFDRDSKPVVSPWDIIHRAVDLQEAGLHDDPWS